MNIIATPSINGVTGGVVYWTLKGAIAHDTLRDAWDMEGLDADLLPSKPSIAQAMHRAIGDACDETIIARSAPGTNSGYNLLRQTIRNGRPSYDTRWFAVAPAKLPGAPAVLDVATLMSPSDAEGTRIADTVADSFARHLTLLTSSDIGAWLVSLAKSLHATPLRQTGGMYFIPAGKLELWMRWSAALEVTGAATMFCIPAMPTQGVIKAVIDAITNETADFVSDIDAKIEKSGLRALDSRKRDIDLFAGKIESYAAIIGDATNGLNEKLDALKTRVEAARMSAFADL
jgi:hypothetical protein